MRGRVAVVLLAAILALAGCSKGPEFAVGPSLDPRASRIFMVRVPGSGLLAGRECAVYLPPGYPAPRRRYPVLYVQDGGAAFDRGRDYGEWFGFDSAADAMIARGTIEPLIIVAIPSDGWRGRDYIPAFVVDDSSWPPTYAADTTRRGGAYVRAVRAEVKPLIDRVFATDPGPGTTGMTGFSLGGLISVYALYQEAATFGIAGGFSGSYFGYSPEFFAWVVQKGRPPSPASLWIDTGLIDDNDDAARELDAIARGQGFVPGVDYEYLEIPDGDHSTTSVRRRVPAFLAFFSRRAAAARPAAVALATRPGS